MTKWIIVVAYVWLYNTRFSSSAVLIFEQELPEQWNNTQKIAQTVKQQVAPLQATEVTCIRNKITNFDAQQNQYRDRFRKLPFLR